MRNDDIQVITKWIAESLLLLSLTSASLFAFEVQIPVRKDNTLYRSATGNLSNGSGEHLFAGTTATGEPRRGLIAFDLTAVPAASRIDNVVLRLSMSRTPSSNLRTVELRRVTSEWGEGFSNAAGEEGGGTAAAPGDATWIHRFYDTESWAITGGDFAAQASASSDIAAVGIYTWGSTTQMATDVEGWVNTPSTNFGWLLLGSEGSLGTVARFDTRENANPNLRPFLIVSYTPATMPKGDANGDGFLNATDLFHLINAIFAEGPPAVGDADVNANGRVDVADIFYLINHLFAGGPAPV